MLGCMDQEGISWFTNPLYHGDEDDAAPTTITPTSQERYYKGNNIGVDDESVPLVDLRICPIVACNMMTPCSLKCVACNNDIDACFVETNLMNNCSFSKFVHTYDNPLGMLCYKCYINFPIASNKLDNITSQCFACDDTCHMHDNEIAPIAFSIFGNVDNCHDKHVHMNNLHTCHVNIANLFDTNGDVQKRRCIMMDDVFIYHAHTLF